MDNQWHTMLNRDGYALLRNRIAPASIRAALNAIEADRNAHEDPALQHIYDNQSYCPNLRDAPVILNLVRCTEVLEPLGELLASPVDAGMLGHVQIAIRQAFNAPRRSPEPHLDGFPTLLNGLDGKGGVTPFTVLVGVFLQGEPGPYAGNLTVWPGSHRRHADYFRRRGPRALQEPMPRLELGEPKQLELRPGDVVLAHYLLGHGAAVNTSPTDRIAAYVRLGWPADEDARWALMSELWGAWRM